MRIINPNYVKPVPQKDTKIRTVITAQMAALPISDPGMNYQEIAAAISAAYPTLQFDKGDVEQAAIDLGFVVDRA